MSSKSLWNNDLLSALIGCECLQTHFFDEAQFSFHLIKNQKEAWLNIDLDPRAPSLSLCQAKSPKRAYPLWPLSLSFPQKSKTLLATLQHSKIISIEYFQGWISLEFSLDSHEKETLFLFIMAKTASSQYKTQIEYELTQKELLFSQPPVMTRPQRLDSLSPKPLTQGLLLSPSKIDPSQAHEMALKAIMDYQLTPIKKRLTKLNNGLKELESNDTSSMIHEAQLLQSVRHKLQANDENIEVHDWVTDSPRLLKLPKGDKNRYIDKLYKKAHALTHRLKELQEQKKEIQLKLEAFDRDYLHHLQHQTLPSFSLAKPESKKSPSPRLAYKEFYTHNGRQILVGRSSEENMLVSFRFARGNDTWLHAHNCPGSHVVLRDFNPNDQESLQDAMQLAKHYSQEKKSSQAQITITQAKYVKTIPGAKAGKVALSSFKTQMCYRDDARLKALLNRN